MIIKPEQINFSKIKRFFAFGCSFTRDVWPSWPDILQQEMSDVEYYNFGRSGGGNLLISSRIIEADARFKFTRNDLVMVMWTTYCREDRWINGRWIHPGNIFTQDTYPEEFVKKYADTMGYLIRDMALMKMAYEYMKFSPALCIPLMSVPFNNQNEQHQMYKEIERIYKPFMDLNLPSMFELEMNGMWEFGHKYWQDGEWFPDYHPSPDRYYGYLEKLNFPLTHLSKNYANTSTNLLHTTKTKDEIVNLFKLYDLRLNSMMF